MSHNRKIRTPLKQAWRCSRCNHLNPPENYSCEHCEAPHPGADGVEPLARSTPNAPPSSLFNAVSIRLSESMDIVEIGHIGGVRDFLPLSLGGEIVVEFFEGDQLHTITAILTQHEVSIPYS